MTKIVKQILLINIIIFIIQSLLVNSDFWFVSLALWSPSSEYSQIHQWITHMFLHANFLHILFNMLVFISFAPMVEKFLGKGFPYFYILAGIFAASLNIITTNSETAMIGASGAVFGVLAASALIEPNNKVYLFFIPIGVKIKWVLPVILAVELFSGVYLDDNVGHFAHIGGALYGLIHISCVNFFKTIKDEERNG